MFLKSVQELKIYPRFNHLAKNYLSKNQSENKIGMIKYITTCHLCCRNNNISKHYVSKKRLENKICLWIILVKSKNVISNLFWKNLVDVILEG